MLCVVDCTEGTVHAKASVCDAVVLSQQCLEMRKGVIWCHYGWEAQLACGRMRAGVQHVYDWSQLSQECVTQ